MDYIVYAKSLTLNYKSEEDIIKNASFSIKKGEFVFISGPSGSGKSTLLKSLYGALNVKGGELIVSETNMANAKKGEIDRLRRKIGIVFQDYKLIKEWNCQKNVMLPMVINGYAKETCQVQAQRLLSHIKLSHKATKYPLELSGGEQQRVALARALSHNPRLILADEPTGNLDDYSSDVIWGLLKGANEQLGITIVVVTHKLPDSLGVPFRHIYIEEGTLYELS